MQKKLGALRIGRRVLPDAAVRILTGRLLRALSLVLAAACIGSAPAAARSLELSARECRSATVGIVPNPVRARELIPPPFQPTNPAGGQVEVIRCADWSIDGESTGPGAVAVLGLFVQSPYGEPQWPAGPRHMYFVWRHVDSRPIANQMRRIGLNGDFVPGISLEDAAPDATAVTAEVPWALSPHSLSLEVGPPSLQSGIASATWWHVGPHGIIRTRIRSAGGSARLGSGSVTAAPGTPLAGLIGEFGPGIGILSSMPAPTLTFEVGG